MKVVLHQYCPFVVSLSLLFLALIRYETSCMCMNPIWPMLVLFTFYVIAFTFFLSFTCELGLSILMKDTTHVRPETHDIQFNGSG